MTEAPGSDPTEPVGSDEAPVESGTDPEETAAEETAADIVEAELVFAGEAEEGVPASWFEEDPVARERDEYKEALIHLKADFENYRKRVTKQQEEQRGRATEALVEKLLPVLDTTDLALAHGAGEDAKHIGAALAGALEREGLERIDPIGGPFDPTLHDAVAHEPGDGGEQEVVEVMRAGYLWKGRVLRPAMVKVRG